MSELRETLTLAAPLAAQQIGFQLMGLVDAAVLGRWSDSALGAATIGNNVLFAVTAIAFGVIMGLDTVIPQRLGAGLPREARRALSAGLRLSVGIGVLTTLVILVTPLLLDHIVDPAIADDARPYLWIRAFGAVPFLLGVAFRSYLAARGITRPLLLAVIVGNIANAALDVGLVFGARLGPAGAAIATVFVQLVTTLVYFRAVAGLDGKETEPLQPPSAADRAEIVGYGLPVGGHLFAEIGIFGVATVITGYLGAIPAAAHGIALGISSFTFSVTMGIGSAASVRVGHAVGANDLPLARRRGMAAIYSGLVVMSVFALWFLTMPRVIGALFTNDTNVIDAAVPLLTIAALFQLSDGTQAIGAGALRGLGDTRATFVANVIGHYAIGLPISLSLAFAASMGAPGLWWGLSAGLTTTAIALVARFLRSTSRTRP